MTSKKKKKKITKIVLASLMGGSGNVDVVVDFDKIDDNDDDGCGNERKR